MWCSFISLQPMWSQGGQLGVGLRKVPELGQGGGGGIPVPGLPPVGTRSLSKVCAPSEPKYPPGQLLAWQIRFPQVDRGS